MGRVSISRVYNIKKALKKKEDRRIGELRILSKTGATVFSALEKYVN